MSCRYPLADLAEALGVTIGDNRGGDRSGQEPRGFSRLATELGYSTNPQYGNRWLRRLAVTGLSERLADRYAIKAGRLPWQVWPEWWDDLESEEAEEDYFSDDPPLDELDAVDLARAS